MSSKQNGAELKSTKGSALLKKFQGAFSERPAEPIELEPSMLRRWTRRNLVSFGAGALATLAVVWIAASPGGFRTAWSQSS